MHDLSSRDVRFEFWTTNVCWITQERKKSMHNTQNVSCQVSRVTWWKFLIYRNESREHHSINHFLIWFKERSWFTFDFMKDFHWYNENWRTRWQNRYCSLFQVRQMFFYQFKINVIQWYAKSVVVHRLFGRIHQLLYHRALNNMLLDVKMEHYWIQVLQA